MTEPIAKKIVLLDVFHMYLHISLSKTETKLMLDIFIYVTQLDKWELNHKLMKSTLPLLLPTSSKITMTLNSNILTSCF